MPALLFSGGIGIPALFLTAGPALHWNARALPVTSTGLRTAIFLISRSETAATLSAMLVLTTQWPHLLKALRAFRIPALAVVMLGMTYRYALSILQTARGMFESGKSRTVGLLTPRDRRRMLAASAGVLLDKSLQMSGEVHQAMLSRGFRGDVQIIDEFNMMYSDWCWLAIFLTIAALTLWTGR
jgi:energy-coupling factor transporter transmembrane protein EcfT